MNSLHLFSRSILVLCLLAALAGPAQSQILFFDFNKISTGSPTESVSTGSSALKEINKEPNDPTARDKKPKKYKSRSGEGVTGQSGDFALDFRDATLMGKDGTGGAAVVDGAAAVLANVKSFTLCGWYKVDEPIGYASRLLEMYNENTQGFFLACDEDGNIALEVNKRRVVSTGLDYRATKVWVFFAAVYNGTLARQNVTFYMGTAEKGLTSVTMSTIVENPLPAEGGTLTIGNSAGWQRPVKGLMDNVAVYGSTTDASGALSEADIKVIFQGVVDKMKK